MTGRKPKNPTPTPAETKRLAAIERDRWDPETRHKRQVGSVPPGEYEIPVVTAAPTPT